ncbi:protein CROWDED NUCLEI 1-like isoform X1 [Iris pallida]|uniref:Protein CROWDED NUCLEI 1-like isoform X1 n=1 Tax=Iris pallida TaxID=29817 RepID=A0AAX6DNU8_IRIPA|nr:protein CROWDED NUCLEI 1-like isoform X1 [Iris pallida]
MFTPQRKGWSLSPRVGADRSNPRGVRSSVLGKGKAVAGGPDPLPPPPPQALLGEKGDGGGGDRADGAEDWRRFREEGFLDESAMQRKDREALVARITELEDELHKYQYNMGLILIEKKDLSSNYDELQQHLSEAEEIFKREQAAHLIAMSESEKREENLRKALGVEKQCVTDLEKALHEMRAEIAEVKFTSDNKLAEANVLETSLEEKCLEVERKLHSADAKLAEASRRSSEIDRKLVDVEARERKLQRDLLSLNTERKSHEKVFMEQREYLLEWEKKLQDGQMRLVDGQRSLNEREDRANETDKVLKEKEEEIAEARRMIDATTNSLKNKEDDVSLRLKDVATKEKEVDIKIMKLDKKEKDLLAIEVNLNTREREEIQKVVDEHKAILDAKKHEFELELENKRKSFDEELASKLNEVDKEKKELKRKEEQIAKREQALENKIEKQKNKEKDLDTKSKALKKWEQSVKAEEKKLEEEKKQIISESQKLVVSRTELESLKAATKAEEQQILIEKESLKLTKEEREQHLKFQSDLKQEIEEYRIVKELVVKEREALKEEREKFEKEWGDLDDKKVALEAEAEKFNDEKQRFENWRYQENERLKNEVLQDRADIQRELEALRLEIEAFENTMEHERSEALEEAKRAQADAARELEIRKHDLEMNMQKKQEEMEKRLQEKENEFEKRREAEWTRVTSSVNINDSKIRKLKVEQDKLEREKEELSVNRRKLVADQADIHKDIDTLRMLSMNLKDQREEFIKERDRFLNVAAKCKSCHNCGVPISELELLDFQASTGIEDTDVFLPNLADGYIEERMEGKQVSQSPQVIGSQSTNSGGRMSWLQKCSRLFKISPGKNVEHSTERDEMPIRFVEQLDMAVSDDENDYGAADNSFSTQRVQSDGGGREVDESERLNNAGDEPQPSLGAADNSIDIGRAHSDYDFKETEGWTTIPSVDEPNEMEGSSHPEKDSQPQPPTQRRRQPSRRGKGKITRTHSVKAVVEDAKAILGEASELDLDREANGKFKYSQNVDEQSQGPLVQADSVAGNTRQKRHRLPTSGMTNELEAEDSEGRSESLSLGGRRKKRNIAPATRVPREKRYNLRGSKDASTVAATQTTSEQAKGHKAEVSQEKQNSPAVHADEVSSKDEAQNVTSTHVIQKSAEGSVIEVHEMASRIVTWHAPEAVQGDPVDVRESDLIKSVEVTEGIEEDGDEVDGAAEVPATPSDGETSEDEDMDEEDDKNNASIGKKLWTFFTT